MKLYTEEQVRKAMEDVYLGCYSFEDVKYIFNRLTPIKLPSDKEIQNESVKHYDNNGADFYFELGAKWMRNKIQGGNNE